MSRRAARLVGAALLVLCLPATASAHPREGRLDPAFAKRGREITPFGSAGEEAAVEVASGPDGSAVVGNPLEGTVMRFLPDGARDARFGVGGRLVLGPENAAEGVASMSFSSRAMAVDDRGRVVVFGVESDSSRSFNPGGFNGEVSASSAVVLRFDAEGKADPTFGEGKGFVRGDFGLGSGLHTDIPMVSALAGGVDSHGRPVFIAGTTSYTGGCYAKPGVADRPRAVVRLTGSGRPDPSFGGGDGISLIQGTTSFPDLGIDGRDRLVAGVGPRKECGSGTTIYRLRRDGRRLASFGSDGVRAFKGLHLGFVEPSGAMVLSDRRGRTLEVVRVRADATQGGGARIHLPIDVGLHLSPSAVDGRGRILLAGFVGSPDGSPAKGQPKHSSFVVARLLRGGTLDRSFGNRGWIFTRFPPALEVTSEQATLDPQDRLLMAGTMISPHHRDRAFAVARYLLGR